MEKGDLSARFDYLVIRIELGQIKLAEAKKGFEEIADLTEEQKKKTAELLVDLEVRDISASITRDGQSKVAAGEKCFQMKKAGRVPTGEKELKSFLTHLLDYAEAQKDAALFGESLKTLKDRFGAKLNARWLQQQEGRLEKLQGSR